MSAEELLDKIMRGEVVMVGGKILLTGEQWYKLTEKELYKLPAKGRTGSGTPLLVSYAHVIDTIAKVAGEL